MLFPRPRPRIRPRRADVIAHRGTAGEAPENTVEGSSTALSRGADGVEIDLCVTRDGHLVLWHDRDPDSLVAIARQSGAEGRAFVPRVPDFGSDARKQITQLSLSEVLETHGYDPLGSAARNLLPGDGPPRHDVTTFDAFATWLDGEPRARVVVLDLKLSASERAHVAPALDRLAALLGEAPRVRSRELYLLTPYAEIYDALATELPRRAALAPIMLVPDFELPGVLDVSQALGARRVSIGHNPRRTWSSTRDDIVEAVAARERGELDWVLVWGANDEKILRELGRLAVDAVLTDDVAFAREVLDQEHARHQNLLRRREQARIKLPSDKVR